MMLLFLLYALSAQFVGAQQLEAYWSDWESWIECSRTCGGGITKSFRKCIRINNETTATCDGAEVRFRMCNIQDCPENSVDYRMLQCSQFNNKPFKGKYFKWAGFSHSAGECELKCMPKNEFFYVTFDEKVADGTRCNEFSQDVCINGTCVPVGCDKQLYSKAQVDKCGVCNGDGSTCKLVENSFKLVSEAFGYVDVVTIPAGATSIKITEDTETTNYLAVTSNGKNILNAEYAISSDYGTRKSHGLLLRYERSQKLNQIKIDGPIEIPIQLHVYVAKYSKSPIIYNYEYYIPRSFRGLEIAVQKYDWIIGNWSKCSKECAYGKQTRDIYCAKKATQNKVEEFNCDSKKPTTEEECNTHPCPPRWYISEWSPCSKSCGEGLHSRRIHCVETIKDGNVRMLDFSKCPGDTPVKLEACYEKKTCPVWREKEWSKCSKSCGNGIQERHVDCVSEGQYIIDGSQCPTNGKPAAERTCHNFPCGAKWIAEEWTKCSSLCGLGMRHRKVTCMNKEGVAVPGTHCDEKKEPKHFEDCQVAGPCKPMWHASEWSKCSAKCGYGMQMRHVSCAELTPDNTYLKADESLCSSKKKPAAARKCAEAVPCQVNYFVSKWGKCSASCGTGYQKRDVRCYADREIDYSNKHCINLIKPAEVRLCKLKSCRQGVEDNVVEVFTSNPVTKKAVIRNTPQPTTQAPLIQGSQAEVVSFKGPANVEINGKAEYECITSGVPAPSIYWTFDGRNLNKFFNTFKTTDDEIDGKVTSRLVVQPSKTTDRRELKCFVQNAYGQDSSVLLVKVSDGSTHQVKTDASIDVTKAPPTTSAPVASITPKIVTARDSPAVIISLSGPVNLNAGENADYQCVGGGFPTPSYTWTLNGKPIDTSRYRALSSGTGSRLILFTAEFKDSGIIKCIVRNSYGSDSSKLSIKVTGKPIVSIYPKLPYYKEGTQVILTCKTSGTPTPQLQWGKDGRLLFGDNSRVIVLRDRIIFKTILLGDSGKYFCKASNSEGTAIDSVVVALERNDGTRFSTCVDDNSRADCQLIASLSQLCSIRHYSSVCCETCKGKV